MQRSGKQALLSLLMVVVISGFITFPGTSLANAPSDVKLAYDAVSKKLSVTIKHPSSFPSIHHIKTVEIKKNGNVVSTAKYESQPDTAEFTYQYDLPAAEGDRIEATATCNIAGSRTATVTLGKAPQ